MISKKQKEILDNILQGMDNKELIRLATELNIKPIPDNANIRQVAYHIAGSYEPKYILEVAPSLAFELGVRLLAGDL